MYCVYGESLSSLLTESTVTMIIIYIYDSFKAKEQVVCIYYYYIEDFEK